MSEVFGFFSAALLASTFAWAGAVKAFRSRRWLEALSVYRIPKPLEPLVFVAVPAAEIAAAGAILLGATRPAGAFSVALLCAFCAALMRAHKEEGDRLPCGCFGGERLRDYRVLLLRNVLLLIPAAILMVGDTVSIRTLPNSIDPLPTALGLVGAVVLGWTALEVTRALRRDRT